MHLSGSTIQAFWTTFVSLTLFPLLTSTQLSALQDFVNTLLYISTSPRDEIQNFWRDFHSILIASAELCGLFQPEQQCELLRSLTQWVKDHLPATLSNLHYTTAWLLIPIPLWYVGQLWECNCIVASLLLRYYYTITQCSVQCHATVPLLL